MGIPAVEKKPGHLAEVHVFTGVNGTGKTRLLSVLAAMLGCPDQLKRRLRGIQTAADFGATPESLSSATLETWDGWERFYVSIPNDSCGWVFPTNFTTSVSHQLPAFAYNGTAYVADAPLAVLAEMPRPNRDECLAFERPAAHSKQLIQVIAKLKLQAAMDSLEDGGATAPVTRPQRIINGVERSVSEITGRKFTFHVASYPDWALSAMLDGTRLPFDLLPDGLRSIIGWLGHAVVMMDVWLQGRSDPLDTEAIFLLDEIESHLHPTWQRRILPAFQQLFPKAQIFVATHSPFVISSLNHGWIHPFYLDAAGRVTIGKPIPASAGDSYISVVEEILIS